MADWLNNLGTSLGNALIGVNNPFGLAPPEGFDRNAAMRQGALSLGMNVLANASENPAVALGRGYRQAQAIASDNQQNAMAAEAMMAAAAEKKRKRQEEQDQKDQFEQFVSTLPPDQQPLARMFPEKFGAAVIGQKFPDPQGGASNWGMSVVPLKNRKTGELVAGQFNQGQGGIFINGQPADPNEWSYDPGALAQDRAEGTMIGNAPKTVIENYNTKVRPEMANLSDTITTLKQAKTYLQKGIQTGSMSDKIQALRGLGAQLGFNVDERVLSDTQSYQNFIGNVVIPRMAMLGGNDSNEELKKLYSMSGGDINQSLSALATTLDFIEKLSVRKFKTLRAQEDVALRYIPGLTPVPLGGLDAAPQDSGSVPDISTMTDEQLEAIANGRQ